MKSLVPVLKALGFGVAGAYVLMVANSKFPGKVPGL